MARPVLGTATGGGAIGPAPFAVSDDDAALMAELEAALRFTVAWLESEAMLARQYRQGRR